VQGKEIVAGLLAPLLERDFRDFGVRHVGRQRQKAANALSVGYRFNVEYKNGCHGEEISLTLARRRKPALAGGAPSHGASRVASPDNQTDQEEAWHDLVPCRRFPAKG
jgi:hypothetical protein